MSLSVSVSKLNGVTGLVLKNSFNGDTISGLTANGVAAFRTPLAFGSSYEVIVQNQPAGKTCTAVDPSGLATSDVVVSVQCPANAYDIFVTAASVSPDIGLAGMDALCNSDVNRTATNTYKTMIYTSTRRACTTPNCSGGSAENLNWVLEANTTYYRPGGGTLIGTTNASGIFTFPLSNAWIGGSHPWTGSNADWTAGLNCSDWTSLAGSANEGASPATTSGALNAFTLACSNTWPGIICVSQ